MLKLYKISILIVLLLYSINNIVYANTTQVSDMNKCEQLYKDGKYETVIKEGMIFIKEYEQTSNYSEDLYTHARNLVADSFSMLGKYDQARIWYAGTSEGWFDPHAIYCYEVIASISVSLKTYDPSFDFNSIYSNSTSEDILLRILKKLLDEKISPLEKRQYFNKIVLEKFNNNSNWTIQLMKYLAGNIKVDELWPTVPNEFISTVSTYVGLNLEISGKMTQAQELYQKALAQKGSTDIELLLAKNRLGILKIKDIFDNTKKVPPINFTYLYPVIASSAKLENERLYSVGNLIDGKPSTAWVPVSKKSGIGEWVEFSFDDPIQVNSLTLINGYAKSNDTFKNNNRVKTVTLEFSDGSKQKVTLKDTMQPQTIQIGKSTQKIRFIINEVYKGAKFDDTCLSGLDIDFESPQPTPEENQ